MWDYPLIKFGRKGMPNFFQKIANIFKKKEKKVCDCGCCSETPVDVAPDATPVTDNAPVDAVVETPVAPETETPAEDKAAE